MHGEGPLHSHTEGDLAHGEGLPEPATLPADHHPLEDLDPFPSGLGYAHMHANRIARAELGQVVAQTRLLYEIGPVHEMAFRDPFESGCGGQC
jgi:hypothetical protein